MVALALEQRVTSLSLVGLGILAMYLGYVRRGSLLPYVSGLLLYVPLAVVVSSVIGPVEGCLATASAVVLGSEQMSFENDLSRILETPTGVDLEASLLAGRLSSIHLRKLEGLAAMVTLVAVASLTLAGVVFYAPALISCAIILIIMVYSYVRIQR